MTDREAKGDVVRACQLAAEARRLDAEARRLLARATSALGDHLTPMRLATLSGLSYVAIWRDIQAKEIPAIYVTRRSQRRCYIRREDAVAWLSRIGLPEAARALSSLASITSPDSPPGSSA